MRIDPSLSLAGHLHADARASEAAQAPAAEAGQKFEAYMIEMMVREMRRTVPEGLFSSSASQMFMGMLDQQIAEQIAQSDRLGLGRSALGGDASAAGAAGGAAGLRLERLPRPGRAPLSPGVPGHLPVEGGRITSRFGQRDDPFHRHEKRMHRGMDIAAPQGTAIRPIREGRVVFAGPRGGLGNAVIVDHGGGMRSVYGHCHELKVREGDAVGVGTVISTVGSTGRSTGPHLHLEVHQDGQAINPEDVLGR